MTKSALEAVKPVAVRRLRVSIRVDNPALLEELRTLFLQAGHEVVHDSDEADIAMHEARPGPHGLAPLADAEPRALLTPRELEVLGAIGQGLTNKAIARRLDISLHTVKFHVESLFRKLGARTRTEALAKAAERRFDV
jgi:DNA-binding CsgD family transcriptional regulator